MSRWSSGASGVRNERTRPALSRVRYTRERVGEPLGMLSLWSNVGGWPMTHAYCAAESNDYTPDDLIKMARYHDRRSRWFAGKLSLRHRDSAFEARRHARRKVMRDE